jgi:hypothetical protein
MIPTTLIITTLLGAAAALPTFQTRSQYPPTSKSTGFTLVANVTDPAKASAVFNTSVNYWTVVGVHVGAGQDTAILDPTLHNTFYQNGTKDAPDDIHYQNDGLIVDGLSTNPPMSIMLSTLSGTASATLENGTQYVGINYGYATKGVGVHPFPDPYPEVYTPNQGTFIVCNESQPVYGRPQYPVRFALADTSSGTLVQTVPDNCVPITLLAQCANLTYVDGNGMEHGTDYTQEVQCYTDVEGIQWGEYQLW